MRQQHTILIITLLKGIKTIYSYRPILSDLNQIIIQFRIKSLQLSLQCLYKIICEQFSVFHHTLGSCMRSAFLFAFFGIFLHDISLIIANSCTKPKKRTLGQTYASSMMGIKLIRLLYQKRQYWVSQLHVPVCFFKNLRIFSLRL